ARLAVRDALADRVGGRGGDEHGEAGHDERGQDDKAPHHALTTFASSICFSSAFRTFPTCWLTIGWKTRWPMLPIGPATWMSATHLIVVRSPSGSRWNSVSMPTIAPTPWPRAFSFAYSIGR